jgi:signal transduction histidine kinase
MSITVLSVADTITGTALLACGTVATWRRRGTLVGPLMLLAGGVWAVGGLVAWAALLHRGVLIHLHLSYPTGRLRRVLAIATVAVAYVTSAVEAAARNPVLTVVVAALVIAAAVDTFARSAGTARKAGLPALWAALGLSFALALSGINQISSGSSDLLIAVGYDLVVAAMVCVLLLDLLRGAWADAVIADLVTTLGTSGNAQGLRDALRRALDDPGLEVAYWYPADGRFVDEAGYPVDVEKLDGSGVARLEDAGELLAVVVHGARSSRDRQLLDRASAAARLAVSNARLNAALVAQLAAVDASRRRIVEAADEERGRLAAQLAEGTSLELADASRLLDGLDEAASEPLLARARRDIAAAQDELQSLARGLRPQALTDGGLVRALPPVVQLSPLPVQLTVTVDRLPLAIETAVYFCCSESLANVAKHASASSASVSVTVSQGLVRAVVVDNGIGGADPRGSGLRGLADRVEALGGSLQVESPAGAGTVVTVMIPL